MFSLAEIRDLRLKLWTAHNPEQYHNQIENKRQSKLQTEEAWNISSSFHIFKKPICGLVEKSRK